MIVSFVVAVLLVPALIRELGRRGLAQQNYAGRTVPGAVGIAALVVSLLSGQVIYEWVDSKGESHFTDDVSTIPAKAKRRVTTGVEPVISVPRSPDAGKPAPTPPPVAPARPSGPDSCERARKQIQDVEQQAQREQAAFEKIGRASCRERG